MLSGGEPGVPFALVGGVALLAVAAWVTLAVAGLAGAVRPRWAAALSAVGAGVLVVVELATATGFGDPASDALGNARGAGLLLLAAGLWARAARDAAPGVAPAVVVPLGAAPGPAVVGAAAGLLAALGAFRARRSPAGAVLAGGLLLAGVSAALAPAARDDETAALAVLLVRGAGALAVLAALAIGARRSLLGKVVAAIVAGVLVAATAAVTVVGTTVARGAEREQAALVRDAAAGRLELLQQELNRTADLVDPVFVTGCARAGYDPASCGAFVGQLTPPDVDDFVLLVPPDGEPVPLGGRAPLGAAEALGLAGGPLVADVVAGGADAVRDATGGFVRLVGEEPGLALAVAVPLERPTPTDPARGAFVYGVRLGERFAAADTLRGGFGTTLLVGDEVVGSNLSENARGRVAEAAADAGPPPEAGLTVPARGSRPTVHLQPLTGVDGAPVGTLALSRRADVALEAQQDALRALLLTALATTAAAAVLGAVVARRTVRPVRQLTAAARRISAGDLSVRTGVSGRDEVGALATAFDTMTGSLARLTGDLRESAARLETVLASMSDGLLATDADGRVTSVNRAALGLTGASAADVVGRPLADVLDLRAATGEPLALDPAARDQPAEVHRADGTSTPVRVAVTALRGDLDGLVVVLRDTTQEREVERMKTEFLSNVSHELRTPLTPIRGYADILASRPLQPEQVSAFAGTILSEALKMNRVVDLLVDVAAIEAGRVDVQPRVEDVKALLDARLAAWRDRAPERADDLRRRSAAGLPPVLVDPTWLAKVLDELVDNAVKHTAPGSAITLTAVPAPDGGVRVGVRDAGPGIDAAESERLFTSFEQRDGSATRSVGGLGLGLSFVRRVARDAGWPLTVTSPAAAGRGLEVAVDLPAGAPPPRARSRASRGAPRRAPEPGQGRSPARPARRRRP